jgi:hypothetical protein
MTDEKWRPVPGFEGHYDVSDRGRVRTWKTGRGKRRDTPVQMSGSASHGRPRVVLRKPGLRKSYGIGTLVLLAFVGPSDQWCLHWDDDPWNNRLENLRWGTAKENSGDARRNGSLYCGEGHHWSKLTDEQCVKIRTARGNGCGLRALAEEFGVTEATISYLTSGKIWRSVGGPTTPQATGQGLCCDDERWLPTFHPDYEISSCGRVRSWRTRGRHKTRRAHPFILAARADRRGRHRVTIEKTTYFTDKLLEQSFPPSELCTRFLSTNGVKSAL